MQKNLFIVMSTLLSLTTLDSLALAEKLKTDKNSFQEHTPNSSVKSEKSNKEWFVDFGLGYSFNKVKESYIIPEGTYTQDKSKTDNKYLVSTSLGREINENLAVSLEFNYIPNINSYYRINLTEPEINSFSNNSTINSKALFTNIEYKLGNFTELKLEPFVFAGLGLSYNSFKCDSNRYDFDEEEGTSYTLISFAKSHKSVDFAYQIGFGVSTQINDNISLYTRFSHKNLGKKKYQSRLNFDTQDGRILSYYDQEGKYKLTSNTLMFGARIKL
jgi:opacity protein-like surface antigen